MALVLNLQRNTQATPNIRIFFKNIHSHQKKTLECVWALKSGELIFGDGNSPDNSYAFYNIANHKRTWPRWNVHTNNISSKPESENIVADFFLTCLYKNLTLALMRMQM